MTLHEQMEGYINVILRHDERLGGSIKRLEYMNEVYAFLHRLPEDKIYTVERIVKTENIELFTNIVALFICEHPGCGISFIRDDLKRFRKLKLIEEK